MARRTVLFVVAALCAVCASAWQVTQRVELKKGWNAFWLGIAVDSVTADELFEAWPTDSVSVYRAEAFTKAGTYVSSAGEAALPRQPFAIWLRGHTAESTLHRALGDAVYVLKASEPYSVTLSGRPVGRRMDWHGAGYGANYFGVSVPDGVSVLPADYLAGFPSPPETVYRFGGTGDVPEALPLLGSQKVGQGEVLVFPSVGPSEWNGAFMASPRYGVDFGEGGTTETVTIRNDSGTTQSLRLEHRGVDAKADPTLTLWYRDADALAATSNQWFRLDAPLAKTLEAGATWTLQLGLDRSNLGVGGESIKDTLVCADQGRSRHTEILPVTAKDLSTRAGRWPDGIWAVTAQLETVTRVEGQESREGLKAHRAMPVRLLLRVDGDGHMELLQRVTAAALPNGEAGSKTVIYGPLATPDASAAVTARLSTPLMPTDAPVAVLEGTFAAEASARWTLAPGSTSNPFRHPYHPDHDGLRADFATPAPDGDVFANYAQPVKPELWSVGNTVTLRWEPYPSLAWMPTETLTGTLTWRMEGLRAEGAVTASGPFAMRRIIPAPDYRKE